MIELRSAICPECGGLLRLNAAQTQGVCKSCHGTTLISGAPGIRQEIVAWIQANDQLEMGDMDSADRYFSRVIDINPEFGEAYFGRFECKVYAAEYYLRLNRGMARCIPDYVQSINDAICRYGNLAVRYAPDEETARAYQKRIQEVEDRKQRLCPPQRRRGLLGRLFG